MYSGGAVGHDAAVVVCMCLMLWIMSFEGVCVANYRHPAPRRGEPGSFLNGATSIPLDPLDPVDPVMSSERAPMYCKKQYSGRFFRENGSQSTKKTQKAIPYHTMRQAPTPRKRRG